MSSLNRSSVLAQRYQRLFRFKLGAGQNIALDASPAVRTATHLGYQCMSPVLSIKVIRTLTVKQWRLSFWTFLSLSWSSAGNDYVFRFTVFDCHGYAPEKTMTSSVFNSSQLSQERMTSVFKKKNRKQRWLPAFKETNQNTQEVKMSAI